MGPPGGVPITWIANYGKRLRPRPAASASIDFPPIRPVPSLVPITSCRTPPATPHTVSTPTTTRRFAQARAAVNLAKAKNNRGWSMDKHEAMEYGQARSFLSSAFSASMGSVLQSLVGTAAGFTRTARSSNARREKLKSSSL